MCAAGIVCIDYVRTCRDISVSSWRNSDAAPYHVNLSACELYTANGYFTSYLNVHKILARDIDLRYAHCVQIWTNRGRAFVISQARRDLLFTTRAVYKLLITDVAKAIVRHIIRDWFAVRGVKYNVHALECTL